MRLAHVVFENDVRVMVRPHEIIHLAGPSPRLAKAMFLNSPDPNCPALMSVLTNPASGGGVTMVFGFSHTRDARFSRPFYNLHVQQAIMHVLKGHILLTTRICDQTKRTYFGKQRCNYISQITVVAERTV